MAKWIAHGVYKTMRKLRRRDLMQILRDSDYACLRRDGVAVYFDEDEYRTARKVLERAVFVRSLLERLLPAQEIPIILFADRRRLIEAGRLPKDSDVLGYYRDGVIHLLSPAGFEDEQNFFRGFTLAHEMTHFALDHAMDGECPLWLSEGMALQVEGWVSGETVELTPEAAPPDYRSFAAGFPVLDKETAYGVALQLTRCILNDYGAERMARWMRGIRDGFSVREAFLKATGEDLHRYYQWCIFGKETDHAR